MQRNLFFTAFVLFALGCAGKVDESAANGSSNQSALGGTDSTDAGGKSTKGGHADDNPCDGPASQKPGEPGEGGPGKPGPKPGMPGAGPGDGAGKGGKCLAVQSPDICKEENGEAYASKLCAANNLELVGILFDTKSGCTVMCCEPGAAPPPPDAPPPDSEKGPFPK